MKFNWKVVIALVVLVVAIIWGADSLRTRFYNGTDLNVGIGHGPVTVTNASSEALTVKLIGARTSTFSVVSDTENISGRSSSNGSGQSGLQVFEFALPPGVSEFTVVGGKEVSFVSGSDSPLAIVVEPLNAEDARITLIVAAIAIFGSLFYLSSANGHRWISPARRQEALDRSAAKSAEDQNFKRMFGNLTSGKR